MLISVGDPSACGYRRLIRDDDARCLLLAELVGFDRASRLVVARDACEACCQQARPSAESLNSVVASLLLEVLAVRDQSAPSTARDAELRRLAITALATSPDELPTLEPLIDHHVTADELARRIEQYQPFVLLRFGDGEWYSILGAEGHNCDRHDFLPETMGRELRSILMALAAETHDRSRLLVGTTCELSQEVRPFLAKLANPNQVHWVSDAIFRLGMSNLQTRRFVIACQQFRGRKVIVGNASLRPVARALQAHHVVVPRENCYAEIDAIERSCRDLNPELLLCCASMASECLLWRLQKSNPAATLADCGSIFDVMLKRPIRSEYHAWTDLIAEHYFPIFRPFCRPGDAN